MPAQDAVAPAVDVTQLSGTAAVVLSGGPLPRLSRMRVVAGGQMTTVRTFIRSERSGHSEHSNTVGEGR